MSNDTKSTVIRGYHCIWQIHYHIVFPVKYRSGLLDDEVTRIIVETAEAIQERYSIEMEAVGCDRDHIHLFCSAHPKIATGRVVQIFKSITTREVFRRKPSIKEDLWGGEFCSDGYYVGTVIEHANWGTVEKCVNNQSHEKNDISDLRQLKLFDL